MIGSVIAIAGATGFVGRVLTRELLAEHTIVGLTRGTLPGACSIVPERHCPVQWRHCDLYSLSQCEKALAGVDIAIYLVHSMLPSAKLTQGSFQDMDLLMADNFARAAERNGVKRIIYLGGFVPVELNLSRHVQSRLEVERVLSSYGVPATCLRTGIVIGPGGSSTRMILDMVRRFPIVLCPSIANSLTQPIALNDVVDVFKFLINNSGKYYGSYDIAGREVCSYRDLIVTAAEVMKIKRLLLPLPFFGIRACKHLLSLCTTAPDSLTSPLVESMRHDMVQRENHLQSAMQQQPTSIRAALAVALSETPEGDKHHCCLPEPKWKREFAKNKVRSVQRIPLPPGKSLQWIADEYARFHHTVFRFFARGDVDSSGSTTIRMRLFRISLLELTYAPDKSHSERVFFYIAGGLLVHKQTHSLVGTKPRLEFRRVLGGSFVIVALHDFVPALPFWFYARTQAIAHLFFMWLFARKMRSIARRLR
jgi:nucleoside-diphosphate-sugar epimerase